MEFAPRYFTSCHGVLAAHGRHVPINIEDCNPEGRGIDLNFALCTKARSAAAQDLKLRINFVRARLLISRDDTSVDVMRVKPAFLLGVESASFFRIFREIANGKCALSLSTCQRVAGHVSREADATERGRRLPRRKGNAIGLIHANRDCWRPPTFHDENARKCTNFLVRLCETR